MGLNPDAGANTELIRALRCTAPPFALPASHRDPYYGAGCHPDIVGRVWDELGSVLPEDCRAMVYGHPALVHPHAGIVFALAYGTAYAPSLPAASIDTALTLGCARERRWSDGTQTDSETAFGSGWLFGNFLAGETDWLNAGYGEITRNLP